jgi:hypothetical protein
LPFPFDRCLYPVRRKRTDRPVHLAPSPTSTIFSRVPTNAQLTLHILRVTERSYNPLPPPPPPPSAGHVKEKAGKPGLDPAARVGDDEHKTIVEADGQGAENDGEGKGEGKGLGAAAVKAGKKTILGGLKIAAKKAATIGADVTVDGTKQKVSLFRSCRRRRVADRGCGGELQVGNKIDRLLYQSRAKDDETPHCWSLPRHNLELD